MATNEQNNYQRPNAVYNPNVAPRAQVQGQSAAPNAQGQNQNQYAGFVPAFTPGAQLSNAANSAYRNQSQQNQFGRDNSGYVAQRKRKRRKRIAVTVVCVLLVALVGAGVAAAAWYNNVNKMLTQGDKSDEQISAINDELNTTTKTFDEPFYMLLIGSDAREWSDAEGKRSDTNIVVRVDPTTNTVTLVSIPRDTLIEIDGYGIQKFNAAYNYDDAAGTIHAAKELLNIDIDHYAEVDFNALTSLVDAVGGVDVYVEERIDDPDADNSSWQDVDPIIIEEGEQHLDGAAALVFARSRAYADGDFTRTKNQRKLIEALAAKILELPATELPGVVQAAAETVTTDLSVGDLVALAQQFKDSDTNVNAAATSTSTIETATDTASTTEDSVENSNNDALASLGLTMYSAMVPSTTAYVGGVSYVINDPAATKQMMTLVDAGKDPSGIECTTDALVLISTYYSDMLQGYSVSLDGTDSTGVGFGGGSETNDVYSYGNGEGAGYGQDYSYSAGGSTNDYSYSQGNSYDDSSAGGYNATTYSDSGSYDSSYSDTSSGDYGSYDSDYSSGGGGSGSYGAGGYGSY